MNKLQFLNQLRQLTASLPKDEAEKYVEYYSEMIDDAIEEGGTEEEAVASMGTPEEIKAYIKENSGGHSKTTEYPKTSQYVPQQNKSNKLPVWAIVVLICCFPIWLPICFALLSVYISLWAVVISLFAAFGSIIVVGIAASVSAFFCGSFPQLLAILGAGLFCTGFGLVMIVAVSAFSKQFVRFTAFLVNSIIRLFRGY